MNVTERNGVAIPAEAGQSSGNIITGNRVYAES